MVVPPNQHKALAGILLRSSAGVCGTLLVPYVVVGTCTRWTEVDDEERRGTR
jgi:hypothetical protein